MSKPNLVAISFALGYLLIALCIEFCLGQGGWGWVFTGLLAFPFSFFSSVVSKYIGGYPAFLIMNAIWWYFSVRLFCYIYMNHRRK
jgi:hypothetical protein